MTSPKMFLRTITFDAALKEFVLDAFNKATDGHGYLVEKSDYSQKVLTQDGEEINIKQFAGIKKGSEIYIKSDLVSLMRLCDAMQ